MKKLAISAAVVAALLSTTAMAEVSISGTSEFYYKNDDSQITANNGDSMGTTDTEIKISFSKKNESGLEFGMVTELDVTTDSTTTTDESYMYISGSAGKLVLGGNDAVTDNFGIGEQDIMDEEVTGTYTSATIQSNAGEKSYGADLTKASYFTPTFGGFQAGVSFYDSGAAGTTDSTSYGASYTIDNLKIGYTNGMQEVASKGDNESQSLGAKLALGNATLIAAVSKVEGDDEDIDSIGFGASYKVNADITVAASTLNSEDSLDLSGTEKEELTQHSFEIKYQIAPGLAGYVNYTDYDYKNGGEASTDDNGAVTQFKIAASF